MLTNQGAEVEIAANGEIAVLMTQFGHKFDLIFMDCQMPCMDGYEASRMIRNNEEIHGFSYTPIIAMTANVMQDEYTKCIEAGMDDYLPKPIKKEQIAKTLQRYMPDNTNCQNISG
jgi:CheY-like chemotaxis protein